MTATYTTSRNTSSTFVRPVANASQAYATLMDAQLAHEAAYRRYCDARDRPILDQERMDAFDAWLAAMRHEDEVWRSYCRS